MTGNRPAAADRPTSPVDRRARAERRWPAVVALVCALILYGTLPSQFPLALRILVVAICVGLLIPVIAVSPLRLDRQTRWSRALSVSLAVVLVISNQLAFGILVVVLVTHKHPSGPADLVAALQVWVTNIIAFAALFWELDRGGPVSRRVDPRPELPHADFRFPQDEDVDAVVEVASRSSERGDWMPGFIDYAYLSLTNSMAYSPTDVMPLSPRAKALMGLQSAVAFILVALVIARAVSLLG
ncbi:hypothetical protein J7E22_16695 [Curtobacterium sp. ISL-83]|nr:hypothetical protein [Curtobacterium sp. ISL-83]